MIACLARRWRTRRNCLRHRSSGIDVARGAGAQHRAPTTPLSSSSNNEHTTHFVQPYVRKDMTKTSQRARLTQKQEVTLDGGCTYWTFFFFVFFIQRECQSLSRICGTLYIKHVMSFCFVPWHVFVLVA